MRVTITGNATGAPELRFTPSGQAVATFSVATSEGRRDSEGKWVDGDPSFVRVVVWRDLAEHVAESVVKGTRLVVSGRFEERSYETREGEKKYAWELTGDDVAASLRFATAAIKRVERQASPVVHDERGSGDVADRLRSAADRNLQSV